jgi:hypothetical protein
MPGAVRPIGPSSGARTTPRSATPACSPTVRAVAEAKRADALVAQAAKRRRPQRAVRGACSHAFGAMQTRREPPRRSEHLRLGSSPTTPNSEAPPLSAERRRTLRGGACGALNARRAPFRGVCGHRRSHGAAPTGMHAFRASGRWWWWCSAEMQGRGFPAEQSAWWRSAEMKGRGFSAERSAWWRSAEMRVCAFSGAGDARFRGACGLAELR